jgi:hypothetical protein
MKIPTYTIILILFCFCSCKNKKGNTKTASEQPAFYNLMTEGDTLVIFRKHLYYWNDRGPGGEGRTYNEYIQRFIITKTTQEIICFTSVEFEPSEFPDTLKFDLFQSNPNYFDDLFDLNLVCFDDYFAYPEICGNAVPLNESYSNPMSKDFEIFEQGWPEYYALRPSKREYFLKMQFQTNYNFFDVIMHFRGRVKRFYSENIPAILSARHPGHQHIYPPGQKPIGKIKK